MPMLSKHFSTDEFLCGCGCGFGGKPDDVDPVLLNRLEDIREVFGPMRVNSGCRCTKHNAAVGGVPTSTHTLGKAADINAPTPEMRYRLVELAYAAGFKRIGVAKTFIHLDTAELDGPPCPALWQYGS